MKRKIPVLITALILLPMLITAALGASENAEDRGVHSITIATADNRPLSIDRLMYTAFKEIGYQTVIKSSASLQLSYELTNNGERGGVISSTPDMEREYPNVIRVPVVIENNNLNVFSTKSGEQIDSWDALSGLGVGILTQRVYIKNSLPEDSVITVKDTPSLLLEGLRNGEYDVIVMSQRSHETIALPEGVFLAGTIESLPEYLYLHKSNKNLLPDITRALGDLRDNGSTARILSDTRQPEPGEKKTVLHIVSFNTEVTREDIFTAGLRGGFMGDDSIEWYTFALNSRRFSADTNRITTIAQLLRQDCASRNVAAIVVSGESAMKFITEYYQLFFRNVPVIFYGMDNEFFKDTVSFSDNCTGIVETPSVYDTAETALRLFPKTRNFYIINDYTEEGRDYKESAQRQLEPLADGVNIEYSGNISRDELMARIRVLPEDSIVFMGSYFSDSNGQYYSQNEMRRALEANCTVPVFTFYSMESANGAIGGKCPDYGAFGEIAAVKLKQLLSGVAASQIEVITDSESYNEWVFDKFALDKWDISLNDLPLDARVYNITPSIWESDPMLAYAMVAIIVLCVAISMGLTLFLNAYNKQKTHLHSARELIKRDKKIHEVKERLERIINTAPLAFMQTQDGVAVETNEYIQKTIGIKPGDKLLPFYTDSVKRAGLTADAGTQKLLENDIVEFNVPGGGSHRFLTNISELEYEGQRGHILWAMDIEELERRKDELQLTRENLQTILDILPTPIMIYTLDDNLLIYANRAAFTLFGAEGEEDMCSKSILTFLAPVQPDGTETEAVLRSFAWEKSYTAQFVLKKLCGAEFDGLVTACHIDYKGRKSSLGMITDLTAEKEYARMLRDTAEKEKEANMLKSRFLVNMSHEIRTPMNAIIGLTEIELRRNPGRESREIYTKINRSAKNLLNIINDILDLSKIEADKIELFDDEFELEEVISSALLVATPRLDEKDVEFMLNVSLDLPRYLIGDRTRLWQILKNFLDNAAKFTGAGKITLTVFEDKERSTDENIFVSFVVEDTGIGMNEEQLKKLFVPYVQIYNDAQKRYTGSGLGMAISKRLCQQMGGELQVESSPGKGTCVYITLPFMRTRGEETELSAVKALSPGDVRVLVVDDDDASREIMRSIFEAGGAVCDTASGGEEALDMVFSRRDAGLSYDLILLDYMLGGINGLETARRIHSGLSSAPRLLMVTAYQRMLVAQDLMECGIDDIIEKPFIPSQFIKKAGEVISGGERGETESVSALPQFKNVRVLLCEDYFLNQEVAAGIFEQFGVETEIAENGRDGIEKLHSGESFDMIFMDLQMPVMDGYETAKAIRADKRYDSIPIISLSADAMKEVVDRCIEHGMNDHIAKPIELEQVSEVFLKWLPAEKRAESGLSRRAISEEPLAEAVRRFGGSKERYENALADFANGLPEKWDDFEKAALDTTALKREVHKIKGAAGNLSETELFQSADLLESSLRAGNPDRVFYERFTAAAHAVRGRGLTTASTFDLGENRGVWTAEEFEKHLARLEQALQEFDPRGTAEAVRQLRSKAAPAGETDTLAELIRLASGYEFEAALELLSDR